MTAASRRCRRKVLPVFRPRLEPLEVRAVPATITWDGGPTGNGTAWLDPVNWAGDVLPGAGDDVVIGSTGGNPTIALGGTAAVNSVTSTRALSVGGTLSILGPQSSFDAVTLSGTVSSGATLTVAGLFSLQPGGRLTGPGTGRLVAAGGATLAGVAGSQKNLDGMTLETPAGAAAAWTAGNINYANGGRWVNGGTLSITGTTLIMDSGDPAQPAFVNTGTIDVTVGQTASFQNPVVNAGTIHVHSGRLELGWNPGFGVELTPTGQVLGDAGSTIWLRGAVTAAAGSVVNGDTVTLSAVGSVGGYYRANATAGGRFTGTVAKLGHVSGAPDIRLASLLPGAEVFDSLTGGLSASQAITVTGPTALAGTVTALRLEALGGLSGQGNLAGTLLVNHGAADMGAGVVRLSAGAVFENRGTLALHAGSEVRRAAGDGSNVLFRNLGTLTKVGPGGAGLPVPIDSPGPVHVAAGQLDLGDLGPSSFAGPVTAAPGAGVYFNAPAGTTTAVGDVAAAGATVGFYSGTYVLGGAYVAAVTDAATPYGIPTLRFVGPAPSPGALPVRGTADFTPAGGPGAVTLDSLTLAGRISGTAEVTVSGHFAWSGGSTVAVPRLEALGGLAVDNNSFSPVRLVGGTLVNRGAATFAGSSAGGPTVTLADGAVFENRGAMAVSFVYMARLGGDTSDVLFRNLGTLTKVGPAGAGMAVPVDSPGSIHVAGGGLGVSAGTYAGPINAAPGTSVTFGGGTVTVTGNVNAAGATVGFDGPGNSFAGTYTFGGAYHAGATVTYVASHHIRFRGHDPRVGALTVGSSWVDFTPETGGPETITLDSLALGGTLARLTGIDTVVVTGPTSLFGTVAVPRLEARGGLTLGNGQVGGGAPTPSVVSGGTLVSDGAAVILSGSAGAPSGLVLANGATFENRGTLTLADFTYVNQDSAVGNLFRNLGTVQKLAGVNWASLEVPLESTGPISVASGSLDLGALRGVGGSTISGPVFAAPGTTLNFNSRSAYIPSTGNDAVSVTGDVNAAGAVVNFGGDETFTVGGAYRAAVTNATFYYPSGTPALRFTGPSADVGQLAAGRAVTFGLTGPIAVSAAGISAPGLTGHGYMTLQTGTLAVGALHLGLNGTAASDHYDRITVTGPISLGSIPIALELGPDMASAVGEVYTLVDGPGTTVGPFAALPEGSTVAVNGYEFRISYANGDVTLATTAVPYHETTTTLAASAATPLHGVDGVTLTATVASAGGTPAGYVTFYDGTTALGTACLVNGGATLALGSTALAAGPHALRAVYAGDANFLESEGADNVAVLLPSAIQGLTYVDFNDDGQVDFGEGGLGGVTVTLSGTDDLGQPVHRVTQTDADGVFVFASLRPSDAGGYTLTESQPGGYPDGRDTLGTINGAFVGGAAANDAFSGIALAPGKLAENYNFGERPASGGAVTAGQTAGIGFWQNKNGQNLIKALNGGPNATQLGHWLAVTFPNMYGMLAGLTNAQVAAHYKALFARSAQSAPGGPPKVDAQVMAAALAVYVTNQTLGGTTAAAYGFQVTQYGVGARAVNVGTRGAAFGVANGNSLSVLDLLLAVNARSRNGVLYDADGDGAISGGEAGLRTMANDVFSAINDAGGI